jgi:NAD(P)-dependent dehydrogenase (short-subunit alcohol dehydrogenase family)
VLVPGVDFRSVDLRLRGAAAKVVEDVVAENDGLDVLANNAGRGDLTTGFIAETDESWQQTLD